MKRIEKLAEQDMLKYQDCLIANPYCGPDLSLPSASYYCGWLEGFCKAREMSAIYIADYSTTQSDEILVIGEEEVK